MLGYLARTNYFYSPSSLLHSILSFRHVALLTDLFCSLAELQPKLQRSVIAVFIVNEEDGIVEGIGVDRLDKCGKVGRPLISKRCYDFI